MLARPASDEYAPYYDAYVSTVPDGDIRDLLRLQLNDTIALLANVDDARAAKGYGPGKWTLKESILHLIDAERVFAYRLLRVARGDQTPLPGFEQDEWVPQSGANGRSVASLLLELSTVRASTVLLIGSIEPAAWVQRGTASGKPISARALAYIIAGHERHHQQVFRERYLA